MRILLALITVFAAFQAQALCYLTGSTFQPEVSSETITLNLDAPSATTSKAISFENSAPNFKCLTGDVTPNVFSQSAAKSIASFYAIKSDVHNLVLKVVLTVDPTKKSTAFLGDLFSSIAHRAMMLNPYFAYTLTYSVQSHYTGSVAGTIDVNTPFTLDNYVVIKPESCNGLTCLAVDNTTHQYRYKIRLLAKFTPTTCTFKNQEISAPDISYHQIDSNGFATPKTKQPELQCSSTTGVATSNIHYHFEPISTLNRQIVTNDLSTQPGSAGEVGFMLTNNSEAITFQPSQKFTLASRGSDLHNQALYPLNLQLRYARYGNNVSSGRVQSRVKVVVDYD